MKAITKKKIPFVIIFGIIFSFSLQSNILINFTRIFGHKSSKYSDEINFDNRNLKTSPVSGKIHINNNWTAAKDAGICTGNGTYSEPYVIENLIIDGEGSGSCILIENSDVHFQINNCTLYNAKNVIFNNDPYDPWPEVIIGAGIKFKNVYNSKLNNNSCRFSRFGIFLEESNNITLSMNNISDNLHYGIYLTQCNGNNVSGNIANNNSLGIQLYNSNDNNISGNTLNNNDYGIKIIGNNNTISGNIFNGCGLSISGNLETLLSYEIDTTNKVNGKSLYYYTNELNLGPNNFTDAGQVILVNVNGSVISKLDLSNCTRGISLFYCNDNNVSRNTASYTSTGIFLYYCDKNVVLENTANNNNDDGMYLYYCNNNIILGNTVKNNNDYGIFLDGNNNTLSGNTANNNNNDGINLDGDNNTLSGNTANNNYDHGIDLGGDNNIISGNTANNNYDNGIDLGGDNNTISGNIMNGCGLSISGNLETLLSYEIDATNLVNGKLVYYYKNEINLRSNDFTNAGQVILVNCRDSIISNLYVSNTSTGISLYYSDNNIVSGNTANNNTRDGIHLSASDNNVISGNTANNNTRDGIHLTGDNNTILGNFANSNKDDGIFILFSDSNTISGNDVSDNNGVGLWIHFSDNNIVSGNTANKNGYCGIHISSISDNNIISENIVNNNAIGIYLDSSDFNMIVGNILIGNVECIIERRCEGNRFAFNYCGEGLLLEWLVLMPIISIGSMIGVAIILIFRYKRKRIV